MAQNESFDNIFAKEFKYLCPTPSQLREINHPPDYIYRVLGGEADRNIFFGVQFNSNEIRLIEEVQSLLSRASISQYFEPGKILKFLYQNQMNPKVTKEIIEGYVDWVKDPSNFELTPLSKSHLDDGYVYLAGVDKEMRPTVVFDVSKINVKTATEKSIMAAFNRAFKIAEDCFFVNSKIENWNIIIEINKTSPFDLPLQIIGAITKKMQSNFPSSLNQVFILNPTSTFSFVWKVIEAFIDKRSKSRIQFFKNEEEQQQLLKYYNPDQLEIRFGGNADNITSYYPPQKIGQKETPLESQKQFDEFQIYSLNMSQLRAQQMQSNYNQQSDTGRSNYISIQNKQSRSSTFSIQTQSKSISEILTEQSYDRQSYDGSELKNQEYSACHIF